jgi:hypothetical protein
MPWKFDQSSGELRYNGNLIGTGYSGKGVGKNNSTMQHIDFIGPIPTGEYTIGPAYASNTGLGPVVMNLDPINHNALGRTLFRIHGDNSTGSASEGCIIVSRAAREKVAASQDRILEVTP